MAVNVTREELSKALLYECSSVLVLSSNTSPNSSECPRRPKCEEDAQRMASTMVSCQILQDSNIATINSTSGQCTKKGIQDAISRQAGKVRKGPDGADGLFIFVYCGGACDLRKLDSSIVVNEPATKKEGEENEDNNDDFVNIEFVPLPQCVHSLVLKDFDAEDASTHVSGETIAHAINTSSASPEQLLVILDCPYAEEIGKDIEGHLKSSCELNLIMSQGKGVTSHYLSPLESSTFSYMFCYFLSKLNCADGVIKLRRMFSKVRECCNALSSLRMVRADEMLVPVRAEPKGKFVQVVNDNMDSMGRIEGDGAEFDDVDYTGGPKVGQFLKLYHKKYWFKRLKFCNEAEEWVRAVTAGPLVVLKEHDLLQGKVLEAVVGSMMASFATIESQVTGVERGDAKHSNIFIQAYVYVAAAIDMLDNDLDLFNVRLLKCAQDFYSAILQQSGINDKEIRALDWSKMEGK